MNSKKNHIVDPKHGKQFMLDFRIPEGAQGLPLVIFTHGIKGFKEWGTWNGIGDKIADAGYIFVKYNFSHNGTTLENPGELTDLETFGRNNYMLELSDLEAVIEHCTTHPDIKSAWDGKHISLIGHSRGGPISLIKAAHDPRITKVITWASVNGLDYAWKNEKTIEDWAENGVMYIINSRTKVAIPLYYQFYQNFIENRDYLDTKKAAQKLEIPWLIVHGTGDEAVPVTSAKELHSWCKSSELEFIKDAGHTFGGRHPFTDVELPKHSQALIQKTILFLNK